MARGYHTVLDGVRSALEEQARSASPGRMLIAVSGGLDSVSLLHAVLHCGGVPKSAVGVAHVDHRLREESGEDAQFVAELARKYEVPYYLHTATKLPPEGSNVEAWGRELRYTFFRQVRESQGYAWTLTAHTAADVTETLLMRLCSNKELGGIRGVDQARHLLRPLRRVSRAAIEAYAAEHGLTWREDKSNSDTTLLRNWVRHELIPMLRKRFGDHIAEQLAERADAVGSDGDYLDQMANAVWLHLEPVQWEDRSWYRSAQGVLRETALPLRWRVGALLLEEETGGRFGRRVGARFVDFILGEATELELPGGVKIKRRNGALVFEQPGEG